MAWTFVRVSDRPARGRLAPVALLAVSVMAASVIAGPARAQMGGMGPLGGAPGSGGGGGGGADSKDAKPPPAPALPGARSLEDTVAPAERPASEMSPTDALFDAIDRGDLAAAREAISRGADLNGRNLLGQSPLDVAIDLGRNPITFLLLSLRNSESDSAPGVRTAVAPPPAASAHGRRGSVKAPVTASVPVPPTLVANGGVPVPSAGFLGFSRTPGATAGSAPALAAPAQGEPGLEAAAVATAQAPSGQAVGGGAPVPTDGFLGFTPTPVATVGLR